MAQRVVVEFLDDIDQSPNATTVKFGIDGVNYAIDLNDQHAAELRGLLEPYAKAGRRPGSKRPAPSPTPTPTAVDPAAVRAWADSNGIKVSKRGRIPAWVINRFQEAGY